jgi:hypothetical protein
MQNRMQKQESHTVELFLSDLLNDLGRRFGMRKENERNDGSYRIVPGEKYFNPSSISV